MGWLFMQSLGGFAGPRQHLDDQFTYARETVRSTVLRSALVRVRTYYAAVEQARPDRGREVLALVCLVKYNPREREGYVFGYKGMDETTGPCEAECPPAILDLLTPTTSDYAQAWRDKCRANAARRSVKPRLRDGWTLVFAEPVRFADGAEHKRLQVSIDPRRPRAVRFRPESGHALYRISRLDAFDYTIEPNG